jgi:serpin B
MSRSLLRQTAAAFALSAAVVFAAPPPADAAAPPREPVAAGANAFGVDLYGVLRRRGGNVFFSPINISTAFSMAYSGARGETAAEMAKVLHLTLPAAQGDVATGSLLRKLASEQDGARLRFANAVWVDARFRVKPAFERSMALNYGSKLPRVDFVADPEGVRTTINRWVEDQTAGRIQNLLPTPPDGPMVITSAVYMKADWARPFAKSGTVDGDFHLDRTQTARTPLMNAKMSLRHLDGGAFQAVAMPYRGGLEMVLFLPKATDGLPAFEQGLAADRLQAWLDALDARPPEEVVMTLPKYRLDDSFTLKGMLRGMGMRLAFTKSADFSGLSTVPLMIAEARHKSYVAVDEAGTEAAAATSIEIVPSSARRGPPPVVFRADHPFFFLIRDRASGTIVFIGRVTNPAS